MTPSVSKDIPKLFLHFKKIWGLYNVLQYYFDSQKQSLSLFILGKDLTRVHKIISFEKMKREVEQWSWMWQIPLLWLHKNVLQNIFRFYLGYYSFSKFKLKCFLIYCLSYIIAMNRNLLNHNHCIMIHLSSTHFCQHTAFNVDQLYVNQRL